MGNYKEGYIILMLDKNTPLNVIESFIDMMCFEKDYIHSELYRDKRINALNKRPEKFFQSEILDDFRVEVKILIKLPWMNQPVYEDLNYFIAFLKCEKKYNGKYSITEIEAEYLKNITITQVKKSLTSKKLKGFAIKLSILSKKYMNEFEDCLEFVRPYLVKGHTPCIGHIEDEDGTISKDIYIDSNYFENQMKQRVHICGGCPEYSLKVDCSTFERCKRAYLKGVTIGRCDL